MPTSITESAIRAHLHTAVFGKTLIVEPQLPSTNDTAKELAAADAPEGTVVVAAHQTAGRGRREHTFFSPTGGVYLSLILRPASPIEPGLLTSCAAVAAARAIESLCGLTVGIKWVNDLFINGRKVSGILAEGAINPHTGNLDSVVLGFGINVAAVTFPPALENIATTLQNEGASPDPSTLVAAILTEWERAYATGRSGDFLEEYRRRSVVLGREIHVLRGDTSIPATAVEIDDAGRLIVRTEAGRFTLHAGEVSVRL